MASKIQNDASELELTTGSLVSFAVRKRDEMDPGRSLTEFVPEWLSPQDLDWEEFACEMHRRGLHLDALDAWLHAKSEGYVDTQEMVDGLLNNDATGETEILLMEAALTQVEEVTWWWDKAACLRSMLGRPTPIVLDAIRKALETSPNGTVDWTERGLADEFCAITNWMKLAETYLGMELLDDAISAYANGYARESDPKKILASLRKLLRA